VGNAVLYGALSALVGMTFVLFQRLTARNRNSRETCLSD
jgi:hypothetical protein